MDAAQAIADLTEISSQIELVVLVGDEGVLGSNADEAARAQRLADGAAQLLAAAGEAAGRADELAQLEAATPEGSVFVVREHGTTIAATTGPEPTVGLVFYDLKSALRSLEAPAAKPKRAPRRKPEADDA